MKHITLLSGSFGMGLTLLGILFEILHWKGGSMLLLLGISAVSLVFIPCITYLFYNKYELVRVKA